MPPSARPNKIDIIHSHYPRENYIAILAHLFYPKAKALYTCHLTLKTNAAWWVTNKLMTPHDAKIIAVCNNAKELLVSNGVNPKKIDVIFNGIPQTETQADPKAIRKEFELSDDTFVISILARYHMSKGLDFLVDSIAALDKKMKRDYVLLIAGDGEYFDAVKEQIACLGLEKHIKQLGFRSDTDNILAASDVYVNSSKCYEALSFAILEAMGTFAAACGDSRRRKRRYRQRKDRLRLYRAVWRYRSLCRCTVCVKRGQGVVPSVCRKRQKGNADHL